MSKIRDVFVHLTTHPNDALAVCTADGSEVLQANPAFEVYQNDWKKVDIQSFLKEQFGNWEKALHEQSCCFSEEAQVSCIEIKGQRYLLLRAPDRQQQHEYKNLFDLNVAGVVTLSADGAVINCNPAFAQMLGYKSHRDIRGKNLSAHYPKHYDRASYLRRMREEKSVTDLEVELITTNGTSIWCLENSYWQQDGEVIQATVMNVTQSHTDHEKYQTLFEHAMDAMFMVYGTHITQVNEQAYTIFGGTENALATLPFIGTPDALVVSESSNVELLTLKLSQAQAGDQHRAKAICRRLDGTQFHAELKLNPIQVGDRAEVCITIRDVTERVLFEEAIQESKERFRLLSQVAIESVAFVFEGVILDCNEQMGRLLGYANREQFIGKKLADYVDSEDLLRLRRFQELSGLNKTEVRAVSRDGQSIFLEASGSTTTYQGKDVEVFLFYDITSRKRTETQLEQSIDRFKNLVENAPNGVFIVTDMLVKYANHSGIQLLGAVEEDDVYDEDFSSFFEGEFKEDMIEELSLVREGEEVEYRETKIHANGRIIDVGFKATLTVYDNKPSIQVTMHNLSTRVMLLQEKVRAELAEEINLVLKREIEEHKITQKKLIAAQSFSRNIIESSIDMIIAVDENANITEFNTAAQKQFSYELREIGGKSAGILYRTESDYNRVRSALEKHGRFSGEIENISREGEVFTCLLSASLIRNNEGDVVGSMGVSRDITELKKAESELRESEERYRDIFDNARDFILSIDNQGQVLYANNAFVQALGYSREELSEKSIYELLAPGTLDKRKNLTNTFVGEQLEYCFKSKTGASILAEGNASVRLEEGKPQSMRAIFRDVTETHAHAQRALEQQARLESIFESTRNMSMWTLDKGFNIAACNRNFVHYMDIQFGETVDVGDEFMLRMEKHIDTDNYADELQAFRDAFEGRPQQFEVALRNQEGEIIWLQVFLNPVYAGNQFKEISCLTYDITDRKEMDQTVLSSLKEKDVLLQEVHHRVKNNLQVISSILNLQSSYVQDEGTLEILQESQNRIKSMSYIHETLYRTTDFSSIVFTDYIQNIARNLIHSYSFVTGEVHLQTHFDQVYLSLDQAIPCGLIINELVSNALKYAYKGIDHRVLTIEITQKDEKIAISVADNGIGLPDNFRYEEADSLGVQLVYTLAEQLDGVIDVKTQPGTRFLITFDKPQNP